MLYLLWHELTLFWQSYIRQEPTNHVLKALLANYQYHIIVYGQI